MIDFLMDKRGNLSAFRVSIAILVFGILLLFAAYIAFQLDAQSLRSPLSVDLPANAQEYGTNNISSALRRIVYIVPDGDIEQISTFYNEQLSSLPSNRPDEDGNQEECNRRPPAGNFPDYDLGESPIAFEWQCFFGRSSFSGEQYTIVKIWPPFTDPERPDLSSETNVIIEYEQKWER